jgi:hypothetical protein
MKKTEMVYGEMINATPAMAQEWLDKNLSAASEGGLSNRKLKERIEKKYYNRMIRGEWNPCNGESIKFDSDGNLIDGQHRLTAQIRTGKSMWWFVVYNCRRDAFKTIDDGTARSGADMLSIHGEKNVNVFSALIQLVRRYKTKTLATGNTEAIPNADMFDAATEEKESGAEDSVNIALSNRAPKGFIAPSVVAFVHFMASKNGNREKADAFVKALCIQEPAENDQPIRSLRKRLTENMTGVKRASKVTTIAWCVKAWNAFYEGRQLSSAGLRYKERATKDIESGKVIAPAHDFPEFANL